MSWQVRTCPISDCWFNFACFGFKIGSLTKFINDSAWFLLEKLKKHGFETNKLNIWQKSPKYLKIKKITLKIHEKTGFPRVPCGPVEPCGAYGPVEPCGAPVGPLSACLTDSAAALHGSMQLPASHFQRLPGLARMISTSSTGPQGTLGKLVFSWHYWLCLWFLMYF